MTTHDRPEAAVILGHSLIGEAGAEPGSGGASFRAVDPVTGAALDPPFRGALPADVDRAAAAALAAAPALRAAPGRVRAELLRAAAANLEADAVELVARTTAETGLAEARLRGELARTWFPLRLFAQAAAEGSWVDARLDLGDPARSPLPRPDLRSMLEPLGPVAVFGASNFPLAFGALGGDTASALAAGCPVVVKAHPLNPGASELAAHAARRALAACGLPQGALNLLLDPGQEAGRRLVLHPAIRAVGFTGSFQGGRALVELAASRPSPIPVFAEMGSVNPVTVLPAALEARPGAIAQALAASVLNSVGQFCTCPGVIVAVRGPGYDAFRAALTAALQGAAPGAMLGARLASSYRQGLDRLARAGARPAFPARAAEGAHAVPALLEATGRDLMADPALAEEVFGPACLLAACADEAERRDALASLPGQLTATVWMEPADASLAAELLPLLRERAGRLLFNGVPTGVEVGNAIVHGGPWPAASASASSVGTRAIARWARPVCYQDAPQALLPAELRDGNPLGLRRLLDGHPE